MKTGNRYKITWIDIQSFPEWKTVADIKAIEPAIVEAVYYYIGKGKAGECFAAESSEPEYGSITIIPKANIKKVKIIK